MAEQAKELIRRICVENRVEILSGVVSPDHIHILVSMDPSMSVSKLVMYIKGKTSRKLQIVGVSRVEKEILGAAFMLISFITPFQGFSSIVEFTEGPTPLAIILYPFGVSYKVTPRQSIEEYF